MKRIFAVLLCLCLFLTACSNQPEETQPSSTAATTQTTTAATTEATTEATTQATTEATTVATEPQVYRNPFNGTLLEEAWSGRPTAVVINNIVDCLPQHGIGQADIVYEYETEGGITRLLAIFSDLSDVGNLGPIRSSRSFFNSTALSYGAPIVHCGGSVAGRNGHYSDNGSAIQNWAHVDEMYNGSYFFRDQARRSSGYSLEHTLFTTGEKLTNVLAAKGYNTPNAADRDYGLQFEDSVSLDGDVANSVTISFQGTKTTTMTFNTDTGVYEASQYKKPQVDGNTGETMVYSNVLVLYTQQWKLDDGEYWRSYYTLIGSGKGYFACGGQIVPIQWHRDDLESPFTFTLEDGTPITLAVGTTYIGVTSENTLIRYE